MGDDGIVDTIAVALYMHYSFRMPLAPVSSYLTLTFLLGVLVLTAFNYPDGTFTIAAIPVVAIALAVGWVILKGSNPFSATS